MKVSSIPRGPVYYAQSALTNSETDTFNVGLLSSSGFAFRHLPHNIFAQTAYKYLISLIYGDVLFKVFRWNPHKLNSNITYKIISLWRFTDGKFHQLPSGELLIHNLEFSDQFPMYRCRTMHRLSRQVVVSSPASVRITGEWMRQFSVAGHGTNMLHVISSTGPGKNHPGNSALCVRVI